MIPSPVSLYVSDSLGSDTERAWAAGFFDGEGWIVFSHDKRPNRRPGLAVGVSQVDDRPMLRFKAATGHLGRITVEKLPKGPNRKVIYRLNAPNSAGLFLLNAIWPWLSDPKKEQFFRVLGKIGRGRYPGPSTYEHERRRARRVLTESQWTP